MFKLKYYYKNCRIELNLVLKNDIQKLKINYFHNFISQEWSIIRFDYEIYLNISKSIQL